MNCGGCGKQIGDQELVALIAGRIMGDDCTDLYYRCARCGAWLLWMARDSITGGESGHGAEPLDPAGAQRRLAIIARCPAPGNERCRCEAHREYFGNWLD